MTFTTPTRSLVQRDPFIAGIVLVLWVLLGIFVLYPLACLFARAFVDGGVLSFQPLLDVVNNPNHRRAFGNSLTLATAVGVGGTALGFLFAFTAVRAGLSKEFDRVLDIDEPQASKPKAKRAADELRDQFVRIFPFVLMMWIVAGSIQPAVDLTAGEKERGTMETLLISPAERNEIVFGKFLAVAFFSFGSVIWNVLWLAGGALIVELLLGFPILNWPGLIGCIIVGFPLAMFFSAICVALGVFARSTKEGQYYLMPLILIAMPLAFSTMLPGTELNLGNSLVPITGALLLQQKLLSISSDPTPWGYFFTVIGGLTVCVTAALWFAVRQFKRESVLFRETGAGQGGSFGKLFGG